MNTKDEIAQIIRVDHAGEFAAINIYAGQYKVTKSEEILHMKQQEEVHFKYFDDAIIRYRVRPTVFLPIWKILAFSLGYVTALMGEKSAMACTIAVEETIDAHYEQQVKRLIAMDDQDELVGKIKQFQAEELEHRDIAVENEGLDAFGYKVLYSVIECGCKIGIRLSKIL